MSIRWADGGVSTVPGRCVALVTAGDPERLTGGYLYNRRIQHALCQAGLPVVQVALPEADGGTQQQAATDRAHADLRTALARSRPALVIVDSIAIAAATPLVTWMQRWLGARVVALMHALPSELARPMERAMLREWEARLLPAVDRVVAVSPHLRDRLIAAGAVPERVVVIMPGRDGVAAPPRATGEREGVHFLCIANWLPAKGIHLVIAALARLDQDVQVELVGEEPDLRYGRWVRGLIAQHGLNGRVRMHGPLRDDTLAARYAAADIFVLPSQTEAFGTVYAEAMSHGLPIIACNIGPLPWLIGADCGILVPQNDDKALAKAMEMLATDAELRRQMGAAARRRALRLPTWRESCAIFVRLTFELLDEL
jgi:glycosyltransferase involved in cell wall biosynthesis